MTYDFPIWVFEGEVANFKEEGLVTPAGGKWENGILKVNLSMQGIEP